MLFRLKRFFFSYNPTEYTCTFFLLLASGAILIYGIRDDILSRFLLVNGGIILFIVVIGIWSKKSPSATILEHVRNWYPVMVVLISFRELCFVIPCVNPHDIDAALIRWDYLIFGVHPTVYMERFLVPYLTEFLQVVYTAYYFLPIILGVAVYRGGNRLSFHHLLFGIVFAIYVSYVGYLVFPAVGPRFSLHHLQVGAVEGVFLTLPIRALLNDLELIMRDAFPSGHTMIPLVTTYYAYKYERRLLYVFVPVTLLIIFSTVYLRYHYAVDVFAGIFLTIPTILLADLLMKRWNGVQKKWRFYPDTRLINSL
jgi:membrane-associated phospholipid phosphatase